MGYRRRDARPRLALWTLVVLGNVVLLLAAFGVAVLATLLSVVVLAGAAYAGWNLTRRGSVTRRGGMGVPVALTARRRA
ncbi:hypothetical protein E0H26_04540 [Micromonospora zingiberis]|uniref:Uncharacterized protein n=1 Tax=Micromonospora zingiberis TaxID=2053011 RepID=A0A4R0GS48_9ACTN|nr:hypothetical protein [Micromonospora zingiberis]TCB99817.1 hypothetical protein E0H26_04540 [Micromonospora zingiberis]